jgi:alcohol dehydrogenase (cytochrome c)
MLMTMSLLTMVLSAQTPAVKNPVEGDAEAIRAGGVTYRMRCALCHGADASGADGGSDLTGLWSGGATDQQIFASVRRDLTNTIKPHSFGPDGEIWPVLAYLRTLDAGPSAVTPSGDAARGQTLFDANCSTCHYVNGRGGRLGPDLSGVGASRSRAWLGHKIRHASSYFMSVYAGGSVIEGYDPVTLVTRGGQRIRGVKKNENAFSIQIMDTRQKLQGYVKSNLREVTNDETSVMPDFGPDRIPDREMEDLLAFLGTLRGSAAATPAPVTGGITFEDLRSGLKDPTRWLQYSGDYTGQRHSPLTQLNPANVNRLTPQWTFQTDLSAFMSTGRSGGLQSVPLVLDGVLYFAGNHNVVWAIDARTGRQIWQYRRELPNDVQTTTTRGLTRGLSLLGDRLFLGTLDAHLIALDIKSGKAVWDTVIEDYHKFFSVTSAPLVIGNNKVVVGIGGGDRGAQRFFLDAYDTQTGQRAWRFYTVPMHGEAGSETWPSGEITGGGATWTTGVYDPDLNLVYWGTGNPFGNSGENRPGDNLYTSSLIAIDAGTGKLRWYYQAVPHDLHDYDANVVPVLAELRIGGQPRKVVLLGTKSGYLYVLDRTNGKFIAAYPMVEGAKNWAKDFDQNGRPILGPDDGTHCLPDIHGGTNYWPPSYDPSAGLFFVTVHEVCEIFNPPQPAGKVAGAPGSWTIGGAGYAALRAFDPLTGKQKWEYRYPPSDFGLTGVSQARSNQGIGLSGGVTSTASGLIFTGDNEGNFLAFDSHTGKPLWHYQTGSPVWGSAAVTYIMDGKQHVLISSGLTLIDFAIPGSQ